MSFWEKNTNQGPKPWEQSEVPSNEIVLDEEAMNVLQEDPNVDIFDEENEDISSIMVDANLRLEMGRLYQMILQNDIFADTNADPRAIKNVQREIRRLVREKMEVMLGIKQEQVLTQTIVSSPFNDMEVTALKMVASKVTKGATEAQPVTPQALPPSTPPKKDGINSISGTLRVKDNTLNPATNIPLQKSTPLSNKSKPAAKPQSQKTAPVSAISKDETLLTKPIGEMSPQELLEYERASAERRARNKSAIPTNLTPHPSPQQLEALYTMAASNVSVANPWRGSGS